jgi:hypothetical protein
VDGKGFVVVGGLGVPLAAENLWNGFIAADGYGPC